jgi:hypothetical protein
MRARDDIAGLSNFIDNGKVKKNGKVKGKM